MWAVPEIYYIDPVSGDDGNDGLAQSTPWKTFQTNFIKTTFADGSVIIIRRGTSEVLTANRTSGINPANVNLPILLTSTPRDEIACTGDFTNGSNEVTNVSGVTLSTAGHCTRLITAPDGCDYMIQHISGTTATLHKNYLGDTGTGASFTIKKDEYYDWYNGLGAGDGRDTAAWDSDTHDMFIVDLNKLYYLYLNNDQGIEISNFFMDNAKANLSPFFNSGIVGKFTGLYIRCVESGSASFNQNGTSHIIVTRYVWEGSGVSNGMSSIALQGSGAVMRIKYMAAKNVINNDTFIGMSSGNKLVAEEITCNTVAGVNGARAIYCAGVPAITLKNYSIANITLPIVWSTISGNKVEPFINIINQNGNDATIKYLPIGSISENDGSGADVNLRTGGADHVIDVFFGTQQNSISPRPETGVPSYELGKIFEHRIWQTALTEKTYRYYVQSVTDTLTTNQLWLEVEGPSGEIIRSDEAITARSDADDWSQYIEAAFTVPEAGWVTIRGFCSVYDATDHRYIDPQIAGDMDGLYVARWVNGESVLEPVAGGGGGGGTRSKSGTLLGVKRGAY